MDPPPPPPQQQQLLQVRVLESAKLSPARHPPASSLPLSGLDADSQDSALLDRLAPRDGDGGPAALALQATRFACGGVALGMRVAHTLCDSAGSAKFLTAAARFARGEEQVVAPVWEWREFLGPRSPPRVVTPFDAVLATDDDVARRGPYGAASYDGHERLARVCFHVSDARVETLRAQLAADAGAKCVGQRDQPRRGREDGGGDA